MWHNKHVSLQATTELLYLQQKANTATLLEATEKVIAQPIPNITGVKLFG